MKKILTAVVMCFAFLTTANAKENITVVSYTGPAGSLMPYVRAVLEKANSIQTKYNFSVINKPGAGGLIALQNTDRSPEDSLALVSAGFQDLSRRGKIKTSNYQPISALGNTCWVMVTNVGDEKIGASSLKGTNKLVVGSVANGSSVHLSGLVIGKKLGIDVQNVVFKTNVAALTMMATDGSINMTIDTPQNVATFKSKNPNLRSLGLNCKTANPLVPTVKPLSAQGFNVPGIWSVVVANKEMPLSKRKEMIKILDGALKAMGQKHIFEKYNYSVPILNGQSTEASFKENLAIIRDVRAEFAGVFKK